MSGKTLKGWYLYLRGIEQDWDNAYTSLTTSGQALMQFRRRGKTCLSTGTPRRSDKSGTIGEKCRI
jgi:hypothetical protein